MTTARPGVRSSAVRDVVDARVKSALPRPAYRSLVRRYNGLRSLVGRHPGQGRALPDFVIIGAVRAGTTSLYGWLSEHPCVVPAWKKELHYFDYNHYRGVDWYRRFFPLEQELAALSAAHGLRHQSGEASPSYISHDWAAQRLAELLPDVKLLVTLRNPVARAYSQFQMSRREGEEPLASFVDAIAAEDDRLRPERARTRADPQYNSWQIGCWSYLMRGRYAEQLERWFELFPREQFHFVTLENLSADSQQALDGVHRFLELPAHRYDRLPPLHAAAYDPLAPETWRSVAEYFRPHNERLYKLLGVDYGWDLDARA
jgi:hypothetical protein